MQIKNDQPSNFTNLLIIGLIIISGYLLYSLTVVFYKSHQIDIYITSFEEENKKIEAENKALIEEFDYVTSEAYIDKILKQDKGLLNPGEELIIIASSNTSANNNGADNFDEFGQRDISNLPNIQKWRIFIFEENPFR